MGKKLVRNAGEKEMFKLGDPLRAEWMLRLDLGKVLILVKAALSNNGKS